MDYENIIKDLISNQIELENKIKNLKVLIQDSSEKSMVCYVLS